jgi:GMP reductase
VRIENEILLDFKDVLIRPKRSTLSSRKEVDLNRTYKFRHSGHEWTGVPIMAANMDGVGTLPMSEQLSKYDMFTCLVKNYDSGNFEHFDGAVNFDKIAISTGTSDKDFDKLVKMISYYPFEYICIDVANGYSEYFGDFVAKVRKKFPTKTIIAGNVVTADMTQELILNGADIVKVGIGPGSVCTTRIQTGVGYAQLSAIMECADAAHGLGGHIIADGGCVCPGDVAKAFGAGADFVMLGGMLAGHDEGGGKIINKYFQTNQLKTMEYSDWGEEVTKEFIVEKKQFVQFYGMSSETAMNKHHGGVAEYRSSEGRTVEIPYKGPVENTVKDILGGLRSTCTYVGAPSLKQLSKCTTFVRVTQQANPVFTGK